MEEPLVIEPGLWTVLQLWVSFLLTFVASVPQIGVLETIDCIFVQAFGRNTFTDDELGGIINRVLLMSNDDYTMLQSLDRMGFDPGNSNRALAKYAMKKADQFKVPIIAQWEVVYAIYEIDLKWYLDHRLMVDVIWPPKEGYFATWHVKLASREKMRKRKCSRPLEVAQPAMIARAVPIVWATGVSPVVERVSYRTIATHELWVWDPNSIQPWTRNFAAWKKREFLGRMAHVATHVPLSRHMLFALKPRLSPKQQQMIPGNWIRFTPPHAQAA